MRFPGYNDNWINRRLGEVAYKINSGKTPLGGESIYTSGGVLFIRSQNINNDKLELKSAVYISEEINNGMKNSVVQPNDILLNITGASLGRSCVVPENFTIGNVNQHVCIIRLNEDYSPKFIQPILSSNKGQSIFQCLQTGSGREGLNFESIKNIQLFFPAIEEQKKIASFLSTIDYRIECQSKIIEELKSFKSELVKKIFSQKLRFKDENRNDYPDWEMKKLKEVCNEHLLKNNMNLHNEVFSVAKHKGVINQIEHLGRSFSAKEISHYKLIFQGDLVYTKSPTSDFPFGIIKQNRTNRTGVVSPLYCVFRPNTFALGYLLHEYFNSSINTYNYLNPLVQKGAKNTMNINNGDFLNGTTLFIPTDENEQIKIANFLSSIDEKIETEKKILEQYKNQKAYLLQNMFV